MEQMLYEAAFILKNWGGGQEQEDWVGRGKREGFAGGNMGRDS